MANSTAATALLVNGLLETVAVAGAAQNASAMAHVDPSPHANATTVATLNSYMFEGVALSKFNSTNGATGSQSSPDIIYSALCTGLMALAYSLIFIGGLVGNLLVFYVVVRNRAMQTVTNIFITNLAVSDIFMSLLCVPFTPAYIYLRRWPFGLVMCHTVNFAQTSSVYVSTLTLMAIAFDRHMVIMFPFRQRMKMTQCIGCIAAIWVLALVFSSPFGIYQHVAPSNITGTWHVYCEEHWSESMRRLVATVTTVLQFVVPFVVIAVCYTRVSIRLTEQAKKRPGKKTGSRKDDVDRERKRRTNRMLVYMVVVFGLVWLPLNTINMLNDWMIINADETDYYNLAFLLSHVMAMSSTCYNPVLYAWKNDNFRKEFQFVLPCYRRDRGRTAPLDVEAGVVRERGSSQPWQPEQTYNGNNETVQEALPTSSFVRSTGLDGGGGDGDGGGGGGSNGNGRMHTESSEDHIRLSDIEPTAEVRSALAAAQVAAGGKSKCVRNGMPETHRLPSGVLETNFEGVACGPMSTAKPKAGGKAAGRTAIRFEGDLQQQQQQQPSQPAVQCMA